MKLEKTMSGTVDGRVKLTRALQNMNDQIVERIRHPKHLFIDLGGLRLPIPFLDEALMAGRCGRLEDNRLIQIMAPITTRSGVEHR